MDRRMDFVVSVGGEHPAGMAEKCGFQGFKIPPPKIAVKMPENRIKSAF